LNDSGGNWAIGSVGRDSLGRSDPDRRGPGRIAGWGDVRVGNRGWLAWLAGNVGAWAIGDCDRLTCGGGIRVRTHGESGCSRAIGGIDVGSDSRSGIGIIPITSPCLSSSD